MSKSLNRVRTALDIFGVATEVLEIPGETRTAQDAAREAGCDVNQIAKSIIFRGEDADTVHLFITAGGNNVDPMKASGLANEELGRADASFVREKTGFAIGGVAPIGHLTESHTYFDPLLLGFDKVYAAAGTPRHIFAISPADLLKISGAHNVDFVI